MQRFPLKKGAAPEARGLSREHGRPIEMAVQLSYEALGKASAIRNTTPNPLC